MKKILIIVFVVALIIGVAFGIKSCNPRIKPLSESEEVLAFIKANTEFGCLLKKSPNLKTDINKSKEDLNNIYAKNGFPTDDDQTMMNILNKYSSNQEALNKIKTNIEKC